MGGAVTAVAWSPAGDEVAVIGGQGQTHMLVAE